MVMHIGGVGTPLASILSSKLGAWPLKPDAQTIPAANRHWSLSLKYAHSCRSLLPDMPTLQRA